MPTVTNFKYGKYQIDKVILNGRVIWGLSEVGGSSENGSNTNIYMNENMAVQLLLAAAFSESDSTTNSSGNFASLKPTMGTGNSVSIDKVTGQSIEFYKFLAKESLWTDTSDIVITATIVPFGGDADNKAYEDVMVVAGDIMRGIAKVDISNIENGILNVGAIKESRTTEEIYSGTVVEACAGIIGLGETTTEYFSKSDAWAVPGNKYRITTEIEHYSYTDYINRICEEYKTLGYSETFFDFFTDLCGGIKHQIKGFTENKFSVFSFGLAGQQLEIKSYENIDSFIQGFSIVANRKLSAGKSDNNFYLSNKMFSAETTYDFGIVDLITMTDTGFMSIANKQDMASQSKTESLTKGASSLYIITKHSSKSDNAFNCNNKDINLWYPPLGYPVMNNETPIINDGGVVLNINDNVDIKQNRRRLKIRQAYDVQIINEKDKVLGVT